jgi:lysophospholipase L1-like esterase
MVGRLLGLAVAATLLVPAGARAAVLYVGDSLGVGTGPYLREQLGGEAMSLDAEVGRPSSVGVGILRSKIAAEDDVVVFDLGTNDDPANPDALAANLRAARQIAADRCLVVATLNRPPLNGVSVDGLNRAVTTFARSDPNAQLVDWHAAAVGNPGLLVDGVHTDGSGYALRAKLFAQAVDACGGVGGLSASAGPTPSGPLEHESSEIPPASAGRQTHAEPKPRPDPGPSQRQQRLHDLAVSVGRAVGTGAEFG